MATANEREVPRLVHKGDQRLRVETTEELDNALRGGWSLHHDPPKVITDADLSLVPAGTAVAQVAEITDISQLEALRNAEVGHPKVAEARADVLRAIDARIAALRKVAVAPKVKAQDAPPPRVAAAAQPVTPPKPAEPAKAPEPPPTPPAKNQLG